MQLNTGVGGPQGDVVPKLLAFVALLTVLLLSVAAAPTVLTRARSLQALATRDANALDDNQRWILGQIEEHDPAGSFVSLLGYTRAGNHATIRARALARMQSLPDWEQRTRDVLGTPNAPEAFTFLAANDIPDPAAFAPAISDGIRQQALLVRERIRRASHPSHLYEGLMIFEVQAVLATVRKFERFGTDYAPAMRELRAAFGERTDFAHPKYRAVEAIDRWLARRR